MIGDVDYAGLSAEGAASRARFLNIVQMLCDEYDHLQKLPMLNGHATDDLVGPRPDRKLLFQTSKPVHYRPQPVALEEVDVKVLDASVDQQLQNTIPANEGCGEAMKKGQSYELVATEPVGSVKKSDTTYSIKRSTSGIGEIRKSLQAATIGARERSDIHRSSQRHFSESRAKKIQDQFERLDESAQGYIPGDTCVEIVTKYTNEPLKLDELANALKYFKCPFGGDSDQKNVCSLSYDVYMQLMDPNFNCQSEAGATLKKLYHGFELEEVHFVKKVSSTHEQLLHLFDVIPAPVILLNALVMGLRRDLEPHHSLWDSLDICFLSFYIIEATMKICVLGVRGYFCGKARRWNWFDLLCIVVSLTDIILERVLKMSESQVQHLLLVKMLRLARIFRLVRALRYPIFNELKTMLVGVISGMRVLVWAILLLVVCVFFLGVVMNRLINSDTDFPEFRTVPSSMFTIFRCFTDGCAAYDGTPLQERVRAKFGAIFTIPYALVFMFITFGLFNLIMAIFIDNVVSAGDARRLEDNGKRESVVRDKFEQMFVKFVLQYRHGLAMQIDEELIEQLEEQHRLDATQVFDLLPRELAITHEVFRTWVHDKDFARMLDEADIDVGNKMELFDVLDSDLSGELGLCEIVDGLMRLRGPGTKADLVAIRLKVRYLTKLVQEIAAKNEVDPFEVN